MGVFSEWQSEQRSEQGKMKFLVFLFLVVAVVVAVPYKPVQPPPPPVQHHKPVPLPAPVHHTPKDPHHHNKRDVSEKSALITDQHFTSDPEGHFEYNYNTQNGISASASGSPKAIAGSNPPEIAEIIQGKFTWVSPEGKTVNVQYTADENGYYPKVQL